MRVPGVSRRMGRNVVWVIVAMLIGSAGLRAATDVAERAPIGDAEDRGLARDATAACTPPPDIAETLALLRDRQDHLDAREAELDSMQATLALARAEIDAGLADLAAAERDLSNLLTLADGAADNDIAQLIAVYEKMKPKDAARLFEAMAPDFAAGFLARMRPEAAADIMTGLSPGAAYSISVLLAGRNAAAPAQ